MTDRFIAGEHLERGDVVIRADTDLLAELTKTRQALKELIEYTRVRVPHVQATISSGNVFPAERPDWVEVHKGRLQSGRQMLDSVMQKMKDIEEEFFSEGAESRMRGHDPSRT